MALSKYPDKARPTYIDWILTKKVITKTTAAVVSVFLALLQRSTEAVRRDKTKIHAKVRRDKTKRVEDVRRDKTQGAQG